MSDISLKERLEGLPQELYDMVHDYTFAADTRIKQKINPSYRAPATSQVNRATRAEFNSTSYSKTVFYGSYSNIWKWLESLSTSQITKIKNIDCYLKRGGGTLEDKLAALVERVTKYGKIHRQFHPNHKLADVTVHEEDLFTREKVETFLGRAVAQRLINRSVFGMGARHNYRQ